jgi:hypothetical protein
MSDSKPPAVQSYNRVKRNEKMQLRSDKFLNESVPVGSSSISSSAWESSSVETKQAKVRIKNQIKMLQHTCFLLDMLSENRVNDHHESLCRRTVHSNNIGLELN